MDRTEVVTITNMCMVYDGDINCTPCQGHFELV